MVSFIKSKFNFLDEHTREVVVKSSSSMVVKVLGMFVGFVVSVFLGRNLGVEDFGVFSLTERIVGLLLVVALLGMPNVLIKEIAIAHGKANFQRIADCIHSSYRFNGLLTLGIVVFFIAITPFLVNTVFELPQLELPLIIALLAIVPMVFSRIHSSALVGYRKIWQSNLFDQTLSIGIVGLLLLVAFVLQWEINVLNVVIVYAISRVLVSVFAGGYWFSLFRFNGKKRNVSKELLKTSLPLFVVMVSGIVYLNSDVLILGWLKDAKAVGLYSVAVKIAFLMSFLLQITNASVAPKIASLYASGEKKEMQKMVQKVTKGLFLLGLFFFFFLIVLGKWILGLWGEEFTAGYWVLLVLGFGQFVNLALGISGVLLIMTGNERLHGKISIIFMLINLVLNVIFGYFWGVEGVAIATAFTIGGENMVKFLLGRRRLVESHSSYNPVEIDENY